MGKELNRIGGLDDMRRVLIVEDNAVTAWAIYRFLARKRGVEIIAMIATGEEAIIRCAHEKVDLVIMDFHLQGKLNGVQTATRIRQCSKVRMIFIAPEEPEEVTTFISENAACNFLPKPFDRQSLDGKIKEIFRRY